MRGGFQLHNEVMRERIETKESIICHGAGTSISRKKKKKGNFPNVDPHQQISESTDLKEIKSRTSKRERSIITYCAVIEGKTPSYPLVSQEKFPRSPYNKSYINPACSVKMPDIGPSIFVCLLTSTPSRSIKTQRKKKELGQYITGWGSLIWAI